MKRREFLKRTALFTAVAAVPSIALARSKDAITFEDLIQMRDLMDSVSATGPYYAIVHPKQMNALKLLTGKTSQYEGITFIESNRT